MDCRIAPLSRRHVHIFDDDWAKLTELYSTSMSPAKAIRRMVRIFLRLSPEVRKQLWDRYYSEHEGDG